MSKNGQLSRKASVYDRNSEIHGVVKGVYLCNNYRTEDLNERISRRNIPSAQLQSQFDMRPVSSKYALMPIYDRRPVAKVPVIRRPSYNIAKTFNPGNAMAPWTGFAEHVNDESRLRRQFFATQVCEQPNYVPSSASDMYVPRVDATDVQQPFPDLFAEQEFAPFNPNGCGVGQNLFDNCTRVQIKNL
jgi:hypothetical protein